MSAAEITALVLAAGGILATLATFITSARNTDLEAVKAIVRSQQDQIGGLQEELKQERDRNVRLEQIIIDRDRVIGQLRQDLNIAYTRLRELEDHA